MVNFQQINETFDERITRRLESLNAVAEAIAVSQMEEYRANSKTDAFISISTLSIISSELEDIICQIERLSEILLSLDENRATTNAEEKQVVSA